MHFEGSLKPYLYDGTVRNQPEIGKPRRLSPSDVICQDVLILNHAENSDFKLTREALN